VYESNACTIDDVLEFRAEKLKLEKKINPAGKTDSAGRIKPPEKINLPEKVNLEAFTSASVVYFWSFFVALTRLAQ
jgi:hypothetical protein